jgi:K+-transporting ATPase KdpF subunit
MSVSVPTAYVIAHLSGADVFGLVVSLLVCGYLLYALIRGERF